MRLNQDRVNDLEEAYRRRRDKPESQGCLMAIIKFFGCIALGVSVVLAL